MDLEEAIAKGAEDFIEPAKFEESNLCALLTMNELKHTCLGAVNFLW